MIRSAPSISTTGRGGRLEPAEVGHHVDLARGAAAARRARACVPCEDVDGGGHIVCRRQWRLDVRPVASKRDLTTFIKLPVAALS